MLKMALALPPACAETDADSDNALTVTVQVLSAAEGPVHADMYSPEPQASQAVQQLPLLTKSVSWTQDAPAQLTSGAPKVVSGQDNPLSAHVPVAPALIAPAVTVSFAVASAAIVMGEFEQQLLAAAVLVQPAGHAAVPSVLPSRSQVGA